MRNRGFLGAVGLLAITAGTNAAVVQFLATSNDLLMRADSTGATFASSILSDDIVGMTVVPTDGLLPGFNAGDILAVSGTTDPASGRFPMYRLDDPFGAATLVSVGSTDRNHTSLAWANGRLFGVNPTGQIRELSLATFDSTAGDPVGGPGAGFGGIQWDGGAFVLSTASDNSIYSCLPPNPGALVGATGVNFLNSGIEFFNGTLYGAFDIEGSDEYVFGSISAAGVFTELAKNDVVGGSTGFVAVPAPGAAALLGLGALMALRRRR